MGSIESTFSGSVHICEIISDISLKKAFLIGKRAKSVKKCQICVLKKKFYFPHFN